nr:type II toxin-antitoxin system RelE/ParE family toxin [Methylobacterium terricola]
MADDLHARNPGAALRVERRLQAALRPVSAYPGIGERKQHDGRRFAVPRCPSLIFSGIDLALNEVSVLTIRHAARREEH